MATARGVRVVSHPTALRQRDDRARSAGSRLQWAPASHGCGISRFQSAAGNRGIQRLLRSGAIQPQVTATPPLISRKCSECEKEEQGATEIPSSVVQAARSPLDVVTTGGRPLEPSVRDSMESRFQRDFASVRVHTDGRAAGSAERLNARAYTTGPNIVFGAGQYNPHTPEGAHLLGHELTHVVQQQHSPSWSSGIDAIPGGGHSIRVLPPLGQRHDAFEREAEAMPQRNGVFQRTSSASLQRIELPRPVPICGAMVTDIDILPPRPRALVECGLPPTVLVTRVNVVGRQRTAGSTGRGRIIFNLHIGYYQDPATRRFCAVISDSTRCLTPGGCLHLGCLPTLREILDAILDFLKFLGIVILLILLYILLRGRRLPTVEPVPPPLYAGAGEEQENVSAG